MKCVTGTELYRIGFNILLTGLLVVIVLRPFRLSMLCRLWVCAFKYVKHFVCSKFQNLFCCWSIRYRNEHLDKKCTCTCMKKKIVTPTFPHSTLKEWLKLLYLTKHGTPYCAEKPDWFTENVEIDIFLQCYTIRLTCYATDYRHSISYELSSLTSDNSLYSIRMCRILINGLRTMGEMEINIFLAYYKNYNMPVDSVSLIVISPFLLASKVKSTLMLRFSFSHRDFPISISI